MDVLIYPHERLLKRALEVTNIDGNINNLIENMFKTMYEHDGIGLAANQVGELLRVVVIDLRDRDEDKLGKIVLINPVIVSYEGEIIGEEGCLSVPGYTAPVSRHERIVVDALNRDGKKITLEAKGLLSRCIQHEIDHLDGICFVDRLGPVKKALFKQKWLKKANK